MDLQRFRITRPQAEIDAEYGFPLYREGDVCIATGARNEYDFKGCGNRGRRVDRDGFNFGDTDVGLCEDGVYGDGVWGVPPHHLGKIEDDSGASAPAASGYAYPTIADYAYPTIADYAYPTIADYEASSGFRVNEAFRIGWRMARVTNAMLGLGKETPRHD